MTPDHARAFVEARLGRPPLDALEAAVVLEAWGGIRSERALALADSMMAEAEGSRARSPASGERTPPPPLGLLDYLGLVVIVAVVAAWSEALADQLAGPDVATAWRVALPISLSVQWVLRRRFLTGRVRLGTLRRGGRFLLGTVAAAAVGLPVALGIGGVMAAMLVVVWVGATIVALRGWALPFGGALVVSAYLLGSNVPALGVLGALAGATLVVSALAIATSPVDRGSPAPWSRAIPAGLVGAGFGLILVSDRGVGWGVEGALPVLAYLPSFVGGLWASIHLRAIWQAVPRAARKTTLGQDERGDVGGPPAAVLAGAALRLVAVVVPLSALIVVYVALGGGRTAEAVGILTGFAAVGAASLVVALLESCNQRAWTLVTVATGCLAALAARAIPEAAVVSGTALMVGGAVVLLLAAGPIAGLIRRPGRTLATSLFIP
jgi:hypothetical protein